MLINVTDSSVTTQKPNQILSPKKKSFRVSIIGRLPDMRIRLATSPAELELLIHLLKTLVDPTGQK